MAWEWSHTEEAYANARANLATLTEEQLIEARVSYQLAQLEKQGASTERLEMASLECYEILREYVHDFGREHLEAKVWEHMRVNRTCDNGGHNAWVDTEGYITVPFSLVAKEEA